MGLLQNYAVWWGMVYNCGTFVGNGEKLWEIVGNNKMGGSGLNGQKYWEIVSNVTERSGIVLIGLKCFQFVWYFNNIIYQMCVFYRHICVIYIPLHCYEGKWGLSVDCVFLRLTSTLGSSDDRQHRNIFKQICRVFFVIPSVVYYQAYIFTSPIA